LDFKNRYAIRDPTENQGYSEQSSFWKSRHPAGRTIKKDYKEAYEHRRFINKLCPTAEEIAPYNPDIINFQSTLDEFYRECFTLSQEILKCLALALNLPGGEDYFKPITDNGDPQLRIMHYPPVPVSTIIPSASADTIGDWRIRPHCDYSFCTILFQDQVGGLEIDPFHTGKYIPATPKPGTVLINIGDLLHRLLNGRVKSTLHRVVAPEAVPSADGSKAMLPSRYSIPFFVHPEPSAMIDPIIRGPDEKKLYKSVNAGDWRSWRTAKKYMMHEQERFFLEKLGIAHELRQSRARK
jgi:isopenicillin N synthase-like dioxygenase